jgi:arabinofuranosyltransferase
MPARSLRNARWVEAATIAVLTAWAWSDRFVQDDAFISFRYAAHLAGGHGFVWNVGGGHLEGFTNFLFTLLIAGCMKLGIEPVTASYAIGLTSFAATLGFAAATTETLTESRRAGWLAIVILGTNFSFRAYATGGLETSLQTSLFTAAAWLVARMNADGDRGVSRLVALSCIAAAAVATRLDSSLVVGILVASTVAALVTQPGPRVAKVVGLLVPGAIVSGALVAFKLAYFGNVLPNTFYAKAPSLALALHGVEYVAAFGRCYGLVAPLLVAAVYAPAAIRMGGRAALIVLACVVVWGGYVAAVGGDFMEFRFLVPTYPLLVTFVLFCLVRGGAPWLLVGALSGAFVIESAAHQYDTYDEPFLYQGAAIETIHGLSEHLSSPTQGWSEIGRALARDLDGADDVTIAVGAAGAIPYFSKLRTIDILGINDAWVAREGILLEGSRPGHTRIAPMSYLVAQHVTLIVLPTASDIVPFEPPVYTADDLHRLAPPGDIPTDARVVEIPVSATYHLRVLYLTPSASVDRLVREGRWRVIDVVRPGAR